MFKVEFAIAVLGCPRPCELKFISTLAHEFKGEKEVLGYTDLDNALKWDTREQAKKILSKLPDWAKGRHEVVKVVGDCTGWTTIYRERRGSNDIFSK